MRLGSRARWLVVTTTLLAFVSPAGLWAQDTAPATPPETGDAPGAGTDVPEPPSGEATSAPETPPTATPEVRTTALVIDAAPFGVAPVVARVVTEGMREGSEELGYVVPSSDDTLAAAQRVQMPFPPSTTDLWRVMWAAGAERAVFARVWSQRDRYVVEVVVASRDGRGPFWARGMATPAALRRTVVELVRQALPPPGAGTAPVVQPPAPDVPEPPSATVEPAQPERDRRRRRRRRRRPTSGFFLLAFGTEAAFGVSNEFFYNHLAGMRLDYRLARSVSVGFAFDYANLRGKNGRVSNVLPYGQFEYRLPLSSGRSLSIPLRFGMGYLPENGLFVRMSGGLAVPLSRSIDAVFDLLSPTFWMLPATTAVSLDVRAEIVFRL